MEGAEFAPEAPSGEAVPAVEASLEMVPFQSTLGLNGENKADLMVKLRAQMKAMEKAADYSGASRARDLLDQLKHVDVSAKLKELQAEQKREFDALATMVQEENEAFDLHWIQKMDEHKERCRLIVQNLAIRHETEQEQLHKQLEQTIRIPRLSKKLLDLRQREHILAKNERYDQAAKLKELNDVLEQKEMQALHKEIRKENKRKFTLLLEKQTNESNVLRDRLITERATIQHARDADFNRLKQRIRNVEQEIRSTHKKQVLFVTQKLQPRTRAPSANKTIRPSHKPALSMQLTNESEQIVAMQPQSVVSLSANRRSQDSAPFSVESSQSSSRRSSNRSSRGESSIAKYI